ncbi:asparaginase [Paracoccus sp. S-4012]|uniref:asparaginase n=1 Tax=Paracoccus sp. S-4012 TaxID=2665648 RepID=UPI0012B02DED|nr:asparaginase [Paracoccus sp. S-4012]MRX49515.1 asparaginase [Paracoccus sp. S-4012]
MAAAEMIELWRGNLREGVHRGHAVVADARGIVAAWGDPGAVIFPRSSCKMIQALPLIESGAADAARLGTEELALACASHSGAVIHTERVGRWLAGIGLGEKALRCGSHMPGDKAEAKRMTCAGEAPCQLHNNCSGKHAGFLTLNQRLGGGPDYVELDHPVQRAVRLAFEEVTEETAAGWGVDGCSAPNFAGTIGALAQGMARFARPDGGKRGEAMARLVAAMLKHPELVAGEGRSCTAIMRATGGRVAVKTGAEAVFVAIWPERGLGIAVKVEDGAARASEAAIVALLVHLGALPREHPVVGTYLTGAHRNWRGLETGGLRLAPGFPR